MNKFDNSGWLFDPPYMNELDHLNALVKFPKEKCKHILMEDLGDNNHRCATCKMTETEVYLQRNENIFKIPNKGR